MNGRGRRCWLEIDGRALRHNLRLMRARLAPHAQIFGVIKANAYGHGLVPVGRELERSGVYGLGVSQLAEAVALREAGVTKPILIFGASLTEEMPESVRHHVQTTLSTFTEAQHLNRAARKIGRPAEAHCKVDTGMGRLGLWSKDAAAELRKILTLPFVRVIGIYTHYACADEDAEFTKGQWREFEKFRAEFSRLPFHVANSAASCLGPHRNAHYARLGLSLFGVPPLPQFAGDLHPILTWKTRLVFVRDAPAGRTISYGATYRLPHPQRLATLAVGYGDGFPRALANGVEVLVQGVRCPMRGRVTMDQIVVDVSRVPAVRAGTEAVLLGRQGQAEITAGELAKISGTISYEILTGLSARLSRLYRHWLSNEEGV